MEKILKILFRDLSEKKPPLAKITEIKSKNVPFSAYSKFLIVPSESGVFENSIIPPDTAICEDCKSEIFVPSSRYYHYPFTVCTNCGPRYTTVRTLPYDRENTTMAAFPLCAKCKSEYNDPLNRRYHAQPVCCQNCGPKIWLSDPEGTVLSKGYEAIVDASDFIQRGAILSIKGFGGFHIACNARKEESVRELRRRLKRPEQPFAVMAKNTDVVESFADFGGTSMEYLTSRRRPIAVLLKSKKFNLAESTSPGLHNIGVMLPYTGTQNLLLNLSLILYML